MPIKMNEIIAEVEAMQMEEQAQREEEANIADAIAEVRKRGAGEEEANAIVNAALIRLRKRASLDADMTSFVGEPK